MTIPAETARTFVEPLRGFFDVDRLRFLREELTRLEAKALSETLSDREQRFESIGAASDEIRLRADWYEIWRGLDRERVDRLRPFTWVVYPLMVRHLKQHAHIVPWHQDQGYMRLLERRPAQIVTCWVPLEEEPSKCTGLRFSLEPLEELPHHPEGPHAACLDGEFPNAVSHDLALGDCVIFGDLVPHSTQMEPGLRRERRSLEIRLVRPDHALPGKDYFDIEQGRFVRADGPSTIEHG